MLPLAPTCAISVLPSKNDGQKAWRQHMTPGHWDAATTPKTWRAKRCTDLSPRWGTWATRAAGLAVSLRCTPRHRRVRPWSASTAERRDTPEPPEWRPSTPGRRPTAVPFPHGLRPTGQVTVNWDHQALSRPRCVAIAVGSAKMEQATLGVRCRVPSCTCQYGRAGVARLVVLTSRCAT